MTATQFAPLAAIIFVADVGPALYEDTGKLVELVNDTTALVELDNSDTEVFEAPLTSMLLLSEVES